MLNVVAGREHIVVIHGVDVRALDGATPEELTAQIKGTVARTFDVPAPSVVLVNGAPSTARPAARSSARSMLAAFMANGVEGLVSEAIDPAVQRVRASAAASGGTP